MIKLTCSLTAIVKEGAIVKIIGLLHDWLSLKLAFYLLAQLAIIVFKEMVFLY